MRYSLRINIGFLWFSQMREVLTAYAWDSTDFEWKESKGWLDKTFYIKGCFEGWSSKIEIVE